MKNYILPAWTLHNQSKDLLFIDNHKSKKSVVEELKTTNEYLSKHIQQKIKEVFISDDSNIKMWIDKVNCRNDYNKKYYTMSKRYCIIINHDNINKTIIDIENKSDERINLELLSVCNKISKKIPIRTELFELFEKTHLVLFKTKQAINKRNNTIHQTYLNRTYHYLFMSPDMKLHFSGYETDNKEKYISYVIKKLNNITSKHKWINHIDELIIKITKIKPTRNGVREAIYIPNDITIENCPTINHGYYQIDRYRNKIEPADDDVTLSLKPLIRKERIKNILKCVKK